MEVDSHEKHVLRPSWQEFQNFTQFGDNNEKLLVEHGALLVVPPEEWQINNTALREELYKSKARRRKFTLVKSEYDSFTVSNRSQKKIAIGKFFKRAMKKSDGLKDISLQEIFDLFPDYEPSYIVDVENNVFPESIKVWNLNNLGDFMSETLKKNGKDIPGLTTPFTYVGTLGAPFALHTEDLNLASISYLHKGAVKEWMVFPEQYRVPLQDLYGHIAPIFECRAGSLDRHKCGMVCPNSKFIKVMKCTRIQQTANTFVIVAPGAFHQGLNMGTNIATAINFGTASWLPLAPSATTCPGHEKRRISPSLTINLDIFKAEIQSETDDINQIDISEDRHRQITAEQEKITQLAEVPCDIQQSDEFDENDHLDTSEPQNLLTHPEVRCDIQDLP